MDRCVASYISNLVSDPVVSINFHITQCFHSSESETLNHFRRFFCVYRRISQKDASLFTWFFVAGGEFITIHLDGFFFRPPPAKLFGGTKLWGTAKLLGGVWRCSHSPPRVALGAKGHTGGPLLARRWPETLPRPPRQTSFATRASWARTWRHVLQLNGSLWPTAIFYFPLFFTFHFFQFF